MDKSSDFARALWESLPYSVTCLHPVTGYVDIMGRQWQATRIGVDAASDLTIDGELVLPGCFTVNSVILTETRERLQATQLEFYGARLTRRMFGEEPVPTTPVVLADMLMHSYVDAHGRPWRLEVSDLVTWWVRVFIGNSPTPWLQGDLVRQGREILAYAQDRTRLAGTPFVEV